MARVRAAEKPAGTGWRDSPDGIGSANRFCRAARALEQRREFQRRLGLEQRFRLASSGLTIFGKVHPNQLFTVT